AQEHAVAFEDTLNDVSQPLSSLPPESQHFRHLAGLSPVADQDLVVQSLTEGRSVLESLPSGEASFEIVQTTGLDAGGAATQTRLDEWRFTVSRFNTIREHLSLGGTSDEAEARHLINTFASNRSFTQTSA